MRERTNRHAWRACVASVTVGSNPTPSANHLGKAMNFDSAMELALLEARQAPTHGDVPVGAVVVMEGSVLALARNERELRGDPTAHAELLALQAAAKKLGSSRLDGATLVTTLEPCQMCAGAAVLSRVSQVVFGAADPKAGACGSLYNFGTDPRLSHNFEVVPNIRATECAELLKEFFQEKR